MARGHGREEIRFELVQNGAHVAHGAIPEKRHGAVGNLAVGFDFGPPAAAMAQTDAILVQRLGDDHVLDALWEKKALFREVGNAAIAAGFFVGRAGDLDGAGEVGKLLKEGFGGDDGGGKPAFHVAGAAPVDPAV